MQVDADHDGAISFDEFAEWFTQTCVHIQRFRESHPHPSTATAHPFVDGGAAAPVAKAETEAEREERVAEARRRGRPTCSAGTQHSLIVHDGSALSFGLGEFGRLGRGDGAAASDMDVSVTEWLDKEVRDGYVRRVPQDRGVRQYRCEGGCRLTLGGHVRAPQVWRQVRGVVRRCGA